MSDFEVTLKLSSDEALVLFEYLTRYCETGQLTIEDTAEQEVLWGLLCDLEKVQKTPLDTNYRDQPRQARERLRPKME